VGITLDATDFIGWPWSRIEPLYRDLEERSVTAETVDGFLADWSAVSERIDETNRRLEVATTQDTTDERSADQRHTFLDDVFPQAEEAEQRLRLKLIETGLEPKGFEVPLRKIRAEANLYRDANLPLLSHEKKLIEDYFQITGGWTVHWKGEEIPLSRIGPALESADRSEREAAWRLAMEPQWNDRGAIDEVWSRLLELRGRIAANADLPDYRAYRWQQLKRFDYTPADCLQFHEAMEEVVVPVRARLLERRRQRMGIESFRPWDSRADPSGKDPLRPFTTMDELHTGMSSIFRHVDPRFGTHFDTMEREGLLDLEPRKNKAPVGYCLPFNASKRPFIFLSLNGMHGDVVALLHEGGHSFHVFEMSALPYYLQRDIERIGIEFGEVGSTAMEMLSMPYLDREHGGFYDAAGARHAERTYLEDVIIHWPYTTLVDAFQHWVYENLQQAADPDACDATFLELSQRFLAGEDWSGLEEKQAASWRSIPHITEVPFYYIEYGLAQLGAVQIWGGARRDQAGALTRYQQALQLGDTRPIPELFRVAGARLAFDAETLREATNLLEERIDELEPAQDA
jgi:oligoendopeptidase F